MQTQTCCSRQHNASAIELYVRRSDPNNCNVLTGSLCIIRNSKYCAVQCCAVLCSGCPGLTSYPPHSPTQKSHQLLHYQGLLDPSLQVPKLLLQQTQVRQYSCCLQRSCLLHKGIQHTHLCVSFLLRLRDGVCCAVLANNHEDHSHMRSVMACCLLHVLPSLHCFTKLDY